MSKNSKPMKTELQIAMGIGLIALGSFWLYNVLQPRAIGLKSVPIIMIIAGLANLIIGIRRIKRPNEDAKAKTQKEANDRAMGIHKEIVVNHEVKESSLYQFFLNSYQSWGNGAFDVLSDYYKSTATKDSPDTLADRAISDIKFTSFVKQCLDLSLPEDNESFLTVIPNDFMMTNKCLYINTNGKNLNLQCFSLCDIKSYTNKGLWVKKAVIGLKNGEEIHFTLDSVPDERRLKVAQELLNCPDTISV